MKKNVFLLISFNNVLELNIFMYIRRYLKLIHLNYFLIDDKITLFCLMTFSNTIILFSLLFKQFVTITTTNKRTIQKTKFNKNSRNTISYSALNEVLIHFTDLCLLGS